MMVRAEPTNFDENKSWKAWSSVNIRRNKSKNIFTAGDGAKSQKVTKRRSEQWRDRRPNQVTQKGKTERKRRCGVTQNEARKNKKLATGEQAIVTTPTARTCTTQVTQRHMWAPPINFQRHTKTLHHGDAHASCVVVTTRRKIQIYTRLNYVKSSSEGIRVIYVSTPSSTVWVTDTGTHNKRKRRGCQEFRENKVQPLLLHMEIP